MGRRGPPKKPATQKMRERTFRPGRDGVTPVASGVVEKPDDLGEFGSVHWDHIIEFVMGTAGGGKCDTESLIACCRAYQRYRELMGRFDDMPPMEIGTPSWKRTFDAGMAAHNAWMRWAGKFGLTPADRANIKQQVDEEVDPLEGMLDGDVIPMRASS